MTDDLISRQALLELLKDPDSCRYGYLDAEDVLSMPTVDAVPVVRCKDCKFFWNMENFGEDSVCRRRNGLVGADKNAYCSYGERRADNER